MEARSSAPLPAVAGLMAARVGQRLARHELEASESLKPSAIDTVVAYRVPSLIGAVLVAPLESDVAIRLRDLLEQRLGAFAWENSPDVVLPLRKYGFLHASIAAPPDTSRDRVMWLELAGTVQVVGGVAAGDRDWSDVRPMSASDRLDVPLEGPIEVRIDVATYSDQRFLGVGVPFYA
jgi:hypothetical protein